MFPHIQAQNREAGSARNSFTHQRRILVSSRNHRQFIAFQHQPCPAGTKAGSCRFLKFCFEVIYGTEITFDSRFQVTLQGGAFFQTFPEQAVVSVTASVVAQYGFLVCWQLVQFGDQLFNRQVSEFWQAFQRRIGVVNVGLMVFGVVDFHGLLIEVRFQGIVSIRQGWQGIAHIHLQYCRAADC